jgi:RimK family alpha-L-glutamate ligase
LSALRLVVISARGGWHVEDLERAAASLGVALERRAWDEIGARVPAAFESREATGGVNLGAFDRPRDSAAVIVRAMPSGPLEGVIFRMDALQALERAGIVVVNAPRALETAIDKYLTLVRLVEAGLSVPLSAVDSTLDAAIETWESLGSDVVVKPLFGSEGKGIVRVSSLAAARQVIAAELAIRGVVYQQEFLDHPGFDIRAFVIGDEVIAAMRRHVTDGWITNVARGGRPEKVELEQGVVELARAAARAVGAEVAGVDILPTRDGRLAVLEVNAVPGWRAVQSVTGIDCARAVIRHVIDRVDRAAIHFDGTSTGLRSRH